MYISLILYILLLIILYYISINNTVFKERKTPDNYFYNILINITYSIFLLILINKYYSLKEKKTIFNILKIIGLMFIFDTMFYWSHIIMHRVPLLRKHLHAAHHKNIDLVPLDFLYEGIFSVLINSVLYFILPCLTLNFIETVIYLVIIITHLIYAHCNVKFNFPIPLFINSKYHLLHHKIGGGNYGLLFPFWDNYMSTRIKKKKKYRTKEKKTL